MGPGRMTNPIVESLMQSLRRRHPRSGVSERDTPHLADALAVFEPRTLSELYMAVRARSAQRGTACDELLSALRTAAVLDGGRGLESYC